MPKRRERMALYIRESDPRLAESTTIESQAKLVREYGEKEGYIYDPELEFREAISAYEIPYMERERLQAMLDAGKKKLFDVLVVSEIRAISRRQVEVLVIYDMLQKYGIRLETVKEKFGEDAMSKAILSLRAMFVEVEVEQARLRMERGKRDRIAIGQAPVTTTPFYTHKLVDTPQEVKGKYVLNPEVVYTDGEDKEWTRIDVAVFICDILVKGGSIRKVCLTLNDMGIPSMKGKLWKPQTVKGMVSNPILYGQPYANRFYPAKKKTFENGHYSHWEKVRPCEEWIPLPPCEPIITRETFDLIQFQINKNRAESMRNNQLKEPGLVRAGYIFCAICGGKLCVHPPSKATRGSANKYECRKRTGNHAELLNNHRINISMRIVDGAVKQKIAEALTHPELIRATVDELRAKRKPVIDVESIHSTIAEINQSIENFLALARHATTSGMIASLAQQMNDLENQKRAAEKLLYAIEDHEAEQAEVEAEIVKFEKWADEVRPFLTDPAYLETATYDELRLAVRILGIRVVVYPMGGEQRLTIDITIPEIMRKLDNNCNSLKPCPLKPTAQYSPSYAGIWSRMGWKSGVSS